MYEMAAKRERKLAHKLLCVETNYTYERITKLDISSTLTHRHLDGFFEHVWVVHPFASHVYSSSWGPKFGRPLVHKVNNTITFIEGMIGYYKLLGSIPVLNFICSQFQLLFALNRIIRSEHISAIRAGGAGYVGLFSWILSIMTGRPLLIRIGENTDAIYAVTGKAMSQKVFGNRKIERMVEGFVLRRAKHIIAANTSYADWLIVRGIKSPVSVVEYGSRVSDDHTFNPPNFDSGTRGIGRPEIPNRYMLYVGRLVDLKHPEDCIKVLAILIERGVSITLTFAGDGDQRNALEDLVREAGLVEKVEFLGACTQKRLADLNRAAAVVLCPLSGASLVEAGYAGAPVVAYDVDWHSSLIEDDVTGRLVPYRDVNAMATAATKVLSDPSYACSLGKRLFNRVNKQQDKAALLDLERSVYERAMD